MDMSKKITLSLLIFSMILNIFLLHLFIDNNNKWQNYTNITYTRLSTYLQLVFSKSSVGGFRKLSKELTAEEQSEALQNILFFLAPLNEEFIEKNLKTEVDRDSLYGILLNNIKDENLKESYRELFKGVVQSTIVIEAYYTQTNKGIPLSLEQMEIISKIGDLVVLSLDYITSTENYSEQLKQLGRQLQEVVKGEIDNIENALYSTVGKNENLHRTTLNVASHTF